MHEYEVTVHTYTADSMCMAPANSTGFRHPGYIYDIVLRNLQPNTRYYYSYGTADVRKFFLYKQEFLLI